MVLIKSNYFAWKELLQTILRIHENDKTSGMFQDLMESKQKYMTGGYFRCNQDRQEGRRGHGETAISR